MVESGQVSPKEPAPPYVLRTPRQGNRSPSPSPHSTPSAAMRHMMPSLKIALPFASEKEPILPLTTSPTRASHEQRGFRSASRRFSYNFKSRASRYSLPLILCACLITMTYMFLSWSHHPIAYSIRRSEYTWFTNGDAAYHETVDEYGIGSDERRPTKHRVNGVSILRSEEELIAEDDLFWEQYREPAVHQLTEQEVADMAELEAHRLDVRAREFRLGLMSIVWWLAEGGHIPTNWVAPAPEKIERFKARDFERMLSTIDPGEEGSLIFEDGWADFAEKRFRVVVFSKTYCPYSKRAKAILSDYHVIPAPFIIELDRRRDSSQIQDLLMALTGRRTVPNIIVDFESIGGSDEVMLLDAEGGLQKKFDALELLPGSRRRQSFAPLQVKQPHVGNIGNANKVLQQAPKEAPVMDNKPNQALPDGPAAIPVGQILKPVQPVKRDFDTRESETVGAQDEEIADAPLAKRAVLPENRQIVDRKGSTYVARVRPESPDGIAAMVDAVRMARPKDKKVVDLYQ